MKITRRQLILSTAAAIGTSGALFSGRHLFVNQLSPANFIIGPKEGNGSYSLGLVDLSNDESFDIPVHFEGHSVAMNPANKTQGIMFAQRPGKISGLFDVKERKFLTFFESSHGRHFYGHGAFSPDGNFLYSTENNFNDGVGVITIRETQNFTVVDEFPSFGIGPHEMAFINQGKTIVVANGGEKTHPNLYGGNGILNKTSMEPSLSYIDLNNRKLTHSHKLDNSFLSMRHLAVSDSGTVAVAIQDKTNETPESYGDSLFLIRYADGRVVNMPRDIDTIKDLDHMTLSIALCEEKSLLVITSTSGNVVTFHDMNDGKLIKKFQFDEPTGVCLSADRKSFILTDWKTPRMQFVSSQTLLITKVIDGQGLGWNNHLTSTLI